jgi:glycerol-3-phosphate acyltransferase PlsY
MNYFIFGFIAYLLGSIPTAVWLGKSKYGIDVREHGSKNAGATNTFRVLGKMPGIVVLSLDVIKGVTAVILPYFFTAQLWGTESLLQIQIVAAICAVFGHVFPLFAGFKGGKGVATSLGVIIGIQPPSALICLAIFVLVFILFKYVSLGAICASIAFPLVLIFVFKITFIWMVVFSFVLSSAVILAHLKNIVRLFKGEENKMNLFGKS